MALTAAPSRLPAQAASVRTRPPLRSANVLIGTHSSMQCLSISRLSSSRPTVTLHHRAQRQRPGNLKHHLDRYTSAGTVQGFPPSSTRMRGQSQRRQLSVCRASRDGGDDSAAESLFARELRKRGLSPPPPRQEDAGEASSPAQEPGARTQAGFPDSAGRATADGAKSASSASWVEGQRDRSQALNSEGLEGLPARALALIRLGLNFSLSFWPLGAALVGAFVGVYLIWGADFIHQGKPGVSAAPAYIDPYELLAQEQELMPLVPYNANLNLDKY